MGRKHTQIPGKHFDLPSYYEDDLGDEIEEEEVGHLVNRARQYRKDHTGKKYPAEYRDPNPIDTERLETDF